MGLFGNLFKGAVGAIIPGLGSALGAASNSKAIGKANAATQAGITQGINALSGAYDDAKAGTAAYTYGGTEAQEQINRLLGLGDRNTGTASNPYTAQEQQAGALSGLRASPLFQQLFNTGNEAVLQNASATGGVRGGNVQNALAENGETAFASTLQQMLANLGGVSSQGLSASSNLASLGQANAGAIASLFGQSGAANAGSILGKQNVNNQAIQQITGQISNAFSAGAGGGAGGIASLFGGAGGGASAIQVNPAAVAGASGGSIFNPGRF